MIYSKESGFKFKMEKRAERPDDLEKIRKGLEATLRALESAGEKEKKGTLIIEDFKHSSEEEIEEEFRRERFQKWKTEFWEEEKKYTKIPLPRNVDEQTRLWNSTPAPLRGKIMDGFTNMATDGVGTETTMVDREKDKELAELCDWAKGLKEKHLDEEERAFRVAQLIFERMGGSDVKDGIRSTMVGKRKLLLGEIGHGVCRHRAPLFQVLAPESGLDSRMEGITAVKGHTGERHADNWVFLKKSGEIIIVDAMYPPQTSDEKGKRFEEMTYDEFKAEGGFPRFGSNRLPFEVYYSSVLTSSKFEPMGESFVRFRGGRLGVDGLRELLKKEQV